MDILKSHIPQDYGNTSHTLFPLSLVVDDFGVKYIGKADADNLISALKNTMKYLNTVQGYYNAASQ